LLTLFQFDTYLSAKVVLRISKTGWNGLTLMAQVRRSIYP